MKKGDQVFIMTDMVPGTSRLIPSGTIGTVIKEGHKESYDPEMMTGYVFVSYPSDRPDRGTEEFWFREESIELVHTKPVMAVEFDLWDMELAEIIMEELK
jgi:hypothetical protein